MKSAFGVRTRLILAMTLSIVLLMAMGGFFFYALKRLDATTKELISRQLPATRVLAETKYRMESHRLRFVRAVFTPDPADRSAILAAAADREQEVGQALDDYKVYVRDAGERAQFERIVMRWRAYLAEESRIFDAFPNLTQAQASDLVNNRSRQAFSEVNIAMNAAIAQNAAAAEAVYSAAIATFDRAIRVSLAIFACALALLAVFVALVIYSVSRPIERITLVMRRLASGDRAISLDGLHGADEIGGMAKAVEVFRGYLIERDLARDALQRSNEALEEKVAARSSELIAANAALQAEVQERIQANRQLESMQQELIRTENLAVIGQLSAGIAHELNQPLAALATLSQNASRFLELGDAATTRGNLERIVRLVDRMGMLTGRLRSFARRPGEERETVDLARCVDNALTLLGHRDVREPMQISLTPPSTPVLVHANAVRVEQILVNLVANAYDATRETPGAAAVIAWRAQEGRAILTVTDNGSGFAPEILKHIFDPFFSTKGKTRGGLGLGLAISADIARLYDGALTAAPGPQGGAIFTLRLPQIEAGAP